MTASERPRPEWQPTSEGGQSLNVDPELWESVGTHISNLGFDVYQHRSFHPGSTEADFKSWQADNSNNLSVLLDTSGLVEVFDVGKDKYGAPCLKPREGFSVQTVIAERFRPDGVVELTGVVVHASPAQLSQ